MDRTKWQSDHEVYLMERKGTYYTRARRYHRVAEILTLLAAREGEVLVDLGSGMSDLDRCLRERGQHFRYVPIDAAIDGTDLNMWIPPISAPWYVAIEVVEHLHHPLEFLQNLKHAASRGIVITTPNPEAVDVLGLCSDHRSPVHPYQLKDLDFVVKELKLYTDKPDTILAWWSPYAKVS